MRLRLDICRAQGGAAAIEAGILFPVLILFGFGAVDTALYVQQTHRMEAGLAAAGSYLAAAQETGSQLDAARRMATQGHPAGGDAVLSGWDTTDVSIAFRVEDNDGRFRGDGAVRVAELTSAIPYGGIGLLRGASGGRLSVRAEYQIRVES